MVRSFLFRAAPPAPRGNIFNWAGLVGRFSMGVIPRASWTFLKIGPLAAAGEPNWGLSRIESGRNPGCRSSARKHYCVTYCVSFWSWAYGGPARWLESQRSPSTVPLKFVFRSGPQTVVGGLPPPKPPSCGAVGGRQPPNGSGEGGGRLPSRICMSSWPRGVH